MSLPANDTSNVYLRRALLIAQVRTVIRKYAAASATYGTFGLWALSIATMIGFAVWGYAAQAVMLPLCMWYVFALTIVMGVNVILAKPADRPLAIVHVVSTAIAALIFAGAYLHPTDELRAAMEARN
jgi:hypothetical protein